MLRRARKRINRYRISSEYQANDMNRVMPCLLFFFFVGQALKNCKFSHNLWKKVYMYVIILEWKYIYAKKKRSIGGK